MIEESRQPGGEVVLRVDGSFDAVAAWQVRGKLGAFSADERVVIDFTRVREFFDLGIAVVANGLAAEPRPSIELRGLKEQQHRLFRYFGVDLGSLSVNPVSSAR
jgi:hypothetical protein